MASGSFHVIPQVVLGPGLSSRPCGFGRSRQNRFAPCLYDFFFFLIVFTSIIFCLHRLARFEVGDLAGLICFANVLTSISNWADPHDVARGVGFDRHRTMADCLCERIEAVSCGIASSFHSTQRQFLIAYFDSIYRRHRGVIVSPDALSALGAWKAYFIEPILFSLSSVQHSKQNRRRLRA